MPFHFPKLDALLREKRDQAIREEFNGANYKELAKKHDLTEQWIRNIIQSGKDPRQTGFEF